MDRANIGVVKSGRSPRLREKAVSAVFEHGLRGEEFESNESTQTLVECLEDFSHTTLPELLHEPIVQYLGAHDERRPPVQRGSQLCRIEKGIPFRVVEKQPFHLLAQVDVT